MWGGLAGLADDISNETAADSRQAPSYTESLDRSPGAAHRPPVQELTTANGFMPPPGFTKSHQATGSVNFSPVRNLAQFAFLTGEKFGAICISHR